MSLIRRKRLREIPIHGCTRARHQYFPIIASFILEIEILWALVLYGAGKKKIPRSALLAVGAVKNCLVNFGNNVIPDSLYS